MGQVARERGCGRDPVDCDSMDHGDRLGSGTDAAVCAACRAVVSAADVRVVARRDDLAVIEVPCRACGTAGLAFVGAPGAFGMDGPMDTEAPAISTADVRAVADFLAGYQGDAIGLFDRSAGPAT